MSTTTEKQVLPLLSDSLYKELKCIAASSNCVISKTLVEAHDAIVSELPEDHNKYVPISDFCSMLTIRANNGEVELSYLPKGRQAVYTASGKWSTEGRQVGKPAKTVGSVLECMSLEHEFDQIKFKNKWCNYDPDTNIISYAVKDQIEYHVLDTETFEASLKRKEKVVIKRYNDKHYEEFANNLKSFYESDVEFKLVTGDDITKYYHYDTYFKGKGGRGTLWESCMRGMSPETFDLYSKSPNCHMLVAFKKDLVVARALVWNTTKGMFMDRVYYYEDFYFNKMKEYAEAAKWHYKAVPNSSISADVMIYSGTGYSCKRMPKMKVLDMYKGDGAFPYLDTFKLYDFEEGVLHNSYDWKWTYELESAGGYHSNVADRTDYHNCVVSDAYYHVSRMREVEGYGYAHISHVVMDYQDKWRLKEDCVQLFDGRWVHELNDDVVVVGDPNYNEDTPFVYAFNTDVYMNEETKWWDIKPDILDAYEKRVQVEENATLVNVRAEIDQQVTREQLASAARAMRAPSQADSELAGRSAQRRAQMDAIIEGLAALDVDAISDGVISSLRQRTHGSIVAGPTGDPLPTGMGETAEPTAEPTVDPVQATDGVSERAVPTGSGLFGAIESFTVNLNTNTTSRRYRGTARNPGIILPEPSIRRGGLILDDYSTLYGRSLWSDWDAMVNQVGVSSTMRTTIPAEGTLDDIIDELSDVAITAAGVDAELSSNSSNSSDSLDLDLDFDMI